MDFINDICDKVASFMWGPFTLILIIGIGIYLTFANGFFQIFYCKDIFKNTIGSLTRKKKKDSKGISPFQAVSTALAGSLGTGNIVGVATAISAGGPGAIFWMWVSAFFGMMLKYAEVLLAVKYRNVDENGFYGGPMYVMEKGLKCKTLGKIFSILCVLASFGMGSTVQANSAAVALNSGFGFSKVIISIVMTVLFTIIIIGGIKRVGSTAEKIVPFMSIIYIFVSLFVLLKNASEIPSAFKTIIECAFDFRATVSGGLGYAMIVAMRYGVARSVFANEAGLGSSPMAHAASNAESPVKQGQWGIFEVFFNTIVMCTMTALVIMVTGALNTSADGGVMTLTAFSSQIGTIANFIIAFCTALFAFTTTMSWAYYGEQSIRYALGEKLILPYRIVYIASIGVGGVCAMSLVWRLSDIFNVMMAIPNLITLVLLSPQVIKMTKEYRRAKKNK